MLKQIICMLALLPVCCWATQIEMDTALLQAMDKVTGRVITLTAPLNQEISFGKLTLTVQKCLTRSAEEEPENTAFLTIMDADATDPVFTGWMFSSHPALSAMEHPVYDIWVLKCKNKEGNE